MDKVYVYRWDAVETHLRAELDRVNKLLANADSEREMWRLQGHAQRLNQLLVLPDTLTVLREG